MPYIDLPGHRLHYRIDGTEGRPWLTFCNSLGTDLHMWDAQIADLSAHFSILRYDQRGHGGSGTPPPPYSLADLGSDLITLLNELGAARTHFCGLSIGGLVGQWLAVHAKTRLDRIILCATAARIGTHEGWTTRIADVSANGLDGLRKATAERWFSPHFGASHSETVSAILDRFVTTSGSGYVGCCAALADADLRRDLAGITAPVLAIAGEDDPVCSTADLAAIASGVQRGALQLLPGRHIVNVESASAFNAAVLRFLMAA